MILRALCGSLLVAGLAIATPVAPALADSVTIRTDEGVVVRRHNGWERDRFEHRVWRDHDRFDRRAAWRARERSGDSMGRGGCRTVTVKRSNGAGDSMTRTIRRCD